MRLNALWHVRGMVPLRGAASNQTVLDGVADAMHRQRKPVTKRYGDGFEFYTPLLSDMFGPNWLALVIFDGGHVWIDQADGRRILRYDLRCFHGFVLCLLAAAVAAVAGLFADGRFAPVKLGLGAFGWLYGGNYLLASLRTPGLFRRAVASAG